MDPNSLMAANEYDWREFAAAKKVNDFRPGGEILKKRKQKDQDKDGQNEGFLKNVEQEFTQQEWM